MTPAAAHARVGTLVDAARSLVTDRDGRFAPSDALCLALERASGLSPENVRWALANALEWRADDDAIKELVAHAGPPVAGPLVLVLSANVTTAALRALACAAARAEEVLVYPSSRDAVLARELVERAALPGLRCLSSRDELPLDDAHACVVLYGSAATARALRPLVRGTLEVHGPGLGVAVLDDATTDAELAALAEDIVAFDQRGCLSPRLAVHIGTPERGRDLAAGLFASLEALGATRPLGLVDEDERHRRTLSLAAARAIGDVWASDRSAVVHEVCAPASPSSSPRSITVHTARSREEAEAWLAPLGALVSAIGAQDEGLRDGLLPGFSLRRCALGAMQRPPFDGPVDRRPHGPVADVSR